MAVILNNVIFIRVLPFNFGRKSMSKLTALAVSIAILGGVWAFLALNPLASATLVWVGFIAWGCYFHSGADILTCPWVI